MSEGLQQRLLNLVEEWRETAGEWQAHIDDKYMSPTKGLVQPPERARAAIRNWVNWLNNCADRVEAALAEEQQRGAVTDEECEPDYSKPPKFPHHAIGGTCPMAGGSCGHDCAPFDCKRWNQ